MTGGLLDRGASRCDPKRGQREVAGEFSVPDFEGYSVRGGGRLLRERGGVPCPIS